MQQSWSLKRNRNQRLEQIKVRTSFAATPLAQPTSELKDAEAPRPSEPTLTQEELDHIAYIQRLAEETSFAAEPLAQPTSEVKDAEAPRPSEPTLTQEELDHIAYIQRLAEETSFAAEPLAQPSPEVKDAEATRPSEPTLTQEELDHIAYIQRLAEETSFAAEPLAQPTSEVKDAEAPRPSEPTLTQEELDHIAYIQRLAEETSLAVQPPPRPAPPSAILDEQRRASHDVEEADIPRYAAELESEEESEPTSGADQGVISDTGSPPLLYERESPLLDREEKPSPVAFEAQFGGEEIAEFQQQSRPLPSWTADEADFLISEEAPAPSEPTLTQEELDHIAYIQKLAEETSFAAEPLAQPTSEVKDAEAPRPSEPTLTQEELDHIAYIQRLAEETSFAAEPLAQPTSEVKDAEAPRPSEPTLTQEELDHIAYIQRLAEETSLAVQPPPRPAPPSAILDEQRRASHDVEEADIPRYAAELESEEESEPTSGADQGVISDTGSPPLLYERESPLLDREEKPSPVAFEAQFGGEEIAEFQQQSRPLPSWTADEADFLISEEAPAPSEPTLTQEELDHIAYIQKLAEETSFAAEPLAQPTSEVKDAEAPRPSEPTLTQEELDHIAYIQRLAEETSFAAEPLAQPTSEVKDAEAPRPSEPTLTQEELDHIAYIQRLAEETSLAVQPPPRPAPPSAIVDEQRRASHDVEEADIPRYAAELESEEESEPTSGADQGVISDTGSPPLLYERESPLLDREEKPSPVAFEAQFGGEEIAEFQQQSRPVPSWTADEADFLISEEAPAPSEPTLTQEELDHIAYIQKLAEETSFAAEPLAQPISEVKEAEADPKDDPQATSSQSEFSVLENVKSLISKSSPIEADDVACHALQPTSGEAQTAPLAEPCFTPAHYDDDRQHPSLEGRTSSISRVEMSPEEHSRGGGLVEDFYTDDSFHYQSKMHERTISNSSSYSSQGSSRHVAAGGSRTNNRDQNIAPRENSQSLEDTSQGSGESSRGASQSSRGESRTSAKFYNSSEPPDSRTGQTDENRKTRFRRRYTSTGAANDSEKRRDLSRSTSVNYTSNLSRTLSRQTSFMSVDQNGRDRSSGGRNNPATFERGSNVRVIYTDHSLRASQSSHPDSPTTSISREYMPVEALHDNENLASTTKLSSGIGVTVDAIDSPSGRVFHRSLSEVVQEESGPQPSDTIRFSLSSSCVANICSHHHAFLNAYELCEQHSFTDSRDLLCNVDFLCRLNFAAHRITEDIADEAERDLRMYFRALANPRARYFTDSSLPRHSTSVSSFDDDQTNGVAFTVEPAPKDVPSLGLFSSLFSRRPSFVRERPRPSIPSVALPFDSTMDTKSRRLSEDRSGDILNLLRRSSGVESRASTSSPIKLPDHALDGLSQTELEHVMAVLNKSNRSLSPSLSRRNSSALQMLPDMENLSDAERQHIQNVLEKAEHRTPYMITVPLSHQQTARTESFQSSEGISIAVSRNSLDDGYDTQIRNIDDAIRKMEQRAESEQNSESPPQGSSKTV
uniref:DNA translocase FtsK n=1 Tax=Haemonchus contortus TaxID=6289 RepID=A0A7I4YQ61_HAECO